MGKYKLFFTEESMGLGDYMDGDREESRMTPRFFG